jgi:hypothetical protein
MKSEDFSTVEEALEHFRDQPFSRVFQGSAAFPENTWRVRNSGVWGQPTLSAETLVVETASDNLGVGAERYWSATPLNPDSFRIEAPFLDGGFFCMTGNYFYGNKGAWVSGARAACAIALELGLRIRPSWLRNYGLESVSLVEIREEILKDQGVRKAEKERQEKE